LLLFNKLFVF